MAIQNLTEQSTNRDTKTKQQKYELTITADKVISTNTKFTMDNLEVGDNYKPLDIYFISADRVETRRIYAKGEKRISNQTLPKLACQLFEDSLVKLSKDAKEVFPICQYSHNTELIRGIYSSIEEYKEHRNTIEFLSYIYGDDRKLVFYCWNLFSPIVFAQECLKRFGKSGDKFVLVYRDKTDEEKKKKTGEGESSDKNEKKKSLNPYSNLLLESKNIIFRGAPGTGKSYLAKEIATDIVSDGYHSDYTQLSEEQKSQIEFVQFHPSYDYTDFVEGLRPKINADGTIGFELQYGIFKKFVLRAIKNYEDSQKSKTSTKQTELKKYIFIIDEINRGEISKIFGELFFAIDPGYRGPEGSVTTQYVNLHENKAEKLYIPENVYIIGTMNDIDRSVDSFDFAMRRRFRFIEIKADARAEMLDSLGEEKKVKAKDRMSALNKEIVSTEGLNENYQIGASYFLKLENINFDQLWTDYLYPLLQDYVRGMYDEHGILARYAKAYGYESVNKETTDGTIEN